MRRDSPETTEPRKDWQGLASWRDWENLELVRGRLAAGADPNGPLHPDVHRMPLHAAAASGTPEVVAELAALVRDVDAADEDGRTALWLAVFHRQAGNAEALLAAGADAWRPVFGGWSPGRLALLSPLAVHFENLPGAVTPSPAERAAMRQAERLSSQLDDVYEGLGVAFVAGIDEDAVIRRLDAEPAEDPRPDPGEYLDFEESQRQWEESLSCVAVTGVDGGCVLSQPWGCLPESEEVLARLSAGTVAYGTYLDAKSGAQARIARDGVCESDPGPREGTDLHDPVPEGESVLPSFLHRRGTFGDAVAYGCTLTGLSLPDAGPVTGPFRRWIRLPYVE